MAAESKTRVTERDLGPRISCKALTGDRTSFHESPLPFPLKASVPSSIWAGSQAYNMWAFGIFLIQSAAECSVGVFRFNKFQLSVLFAPFPEGTHSLNTCTVPAPASLHSGLGKWGGEITHVMSLPDGRALDSENMWPMVAWEYSVSDESRTCDPDALLPYPSLHIPEGPSDTRTREVLRQGQNKLSLLCRYMALTAHKGKILACAMLA